MNLNEADHLYLHFVDCCLQHLTRWRQDNSYFCYSWGYREKHGSLLDYPEFRKPLGRPKGAAVRNGWVYTRSFVGAEVRVDLANRKAKIDWKSAASKSAPRQVECRVDESQQ